MFASKIAKQKGGTSGPSVGKSVFPRGAPAVRAGGPQVALLQRMTGIEAGPQPRSRRDIGRTSGAERVQAKLVVGSVNDPLELEADRVADQVMRMPARSLGASSTIQRKCADCEEEQHADTLRAKGEGGLDLGGAAAPSAVEAVLRSGGRPLDSQARAFFEPRFGRDFSQVRIHSDGQAARSARSIGARAYTLGTHIAFADGQYSPGSDHGRRLLAHELTHTIQQCGARIRRQSDLVGQGVKGLVDKDEEMSGLEQASGPSGQVIRRSATWKGATVHETLNMADFATGASDAPITWHLLNGTKLESDANADTAIKKPGLTTSPLPSTNPAATWMAKVDTVPAQEGSGDETVLAPGPWTRVVTKVAAGGVTGLAACAGAGDSTFTVKGNPSDDSVFKANRRHEDHHLADHKAAFEDAIGKWDQKLESAKTAGTQFTGSSAADATTKLWAAMGNTPEAAARDYMAQGFAKGEAYHLTPAGGMMSLSNPVSNADCSTSQIDVTNPS